MGNCGDSNNMRFFNHIN